MKREYRRFHIGDKFGRLTIVALNGEYANCTCECGGNKRTRKDNLRSGAAKSCGCMQVENCGTINRKHGMYKSRTYSAWSAMIQRCHNKNSDNFQHYGGRGIEVCDKWRNSFAEFLADMGECPDGMEIDRRDNDLNYSPDNCRWISHQENTRNTRASKTWVIDGVEYDSISHAREGTGLSSKTITDWAKNKPGCSSSPKY